MDSFIISLLTYFLGSLLNQADANILNTYQSERRPVAIYNTQLSIKNWLEAIEVPRALGFDVTYLDVF